MYVRCVNRVVFSMFGGLGVDFCKDIYEAKLFGMHIGSVLSGLDAGNVNTDLKMLSLSVFWVENECVWSKMAFFRGGDFYKDIYETKLFGMHSGSVLRGWNAGNANTDLKMSI